MKGFRKFVELSKRQEGIQDEVVTRNHKKAEVSKS
jgi:hypothetical protein